MSSVAADLERLAAEIAAARERCGPEIRLHQLVRLLLLEEQVRALAHELAPDCMRP